MPAYTLADELAITQRSYDLSLENTVSGSGSKAVSFDLEAMQKMFIESRRNNPALSAALRQESSLVEQYNNLAMIDQGIRRFLPRFSDYEHTKKVEDMSALIGELHGLKAEGIAAIDNVAGGFFVLGGVGLFAGISVGQVLGFDVAADATQPDAAIQTIRHFTHVTLPAYAAALSGIAGGLLAQRRRNYDRIGAWQNANLIDDTIRELYYPHQNIPT